MTVVGSLLHSLISRLHDGSAFGEALVLPAQLADGWADCALGRIAVDDQLHGGVEADEGDARCLRIQHFGSQPQGAIGGAVVDPEPG